MKTEFGAWMVGSCDSERVIVITALTPQPANLGARWGQGITTVSRIGSSTDWNKFPIVLFSKSRIQFLSLLPTIFMVEIFFLHT